MDIGTATVAAAIINFIGMIVVGLMVNRIRHATNGMKAKLEQGQYDRGVRDEHARAKEEQHNG